MCCHGWTSGSGVVGEDGQQVPDAGVDVRRRALEGGVALPVGRRWPCWVGDAPVDPPWLVGELGAGLAGLVAQGDHVVELAAGQRVQVPRPLVGDVDAELLAQDPYGVGVDTWFGVAAGADYRRHRRRLRWRSRASAIGERALLPVQTNSTRGRTRPFGYSGAEGGVGAEAERRVQGETDGGQRVRAAVQVQVVVAVAAVEAAASGGDQPAAPQQPQMVGDQVLRLTGQLDQFADPVVACGQFGQQPPPQRVGGQPHKNRGGLIGEHYGHNTSNPFDVLCRV